MHTVKIYTDGACSKGKGGWAALLTVIVRGEYHHKMISGAVPNTTNNRMEMQAAIEGLRALKEPCRVQIITDSQLLMRCAKGEWKRKANKDLWRKFNKAAKGHEIYWKWVKGHNGHTENELVDQEAQRQRKTL